MKAATLSLGLLLGAAPAAHAGPFSGRDDCAPCTRNARGEYAAELCQALTVQDLDCAALAGYAEAVRGAANARALATYQGLRPVRASRPAPALPSMVEATPPPPPPVQAVPVSGPGPATAPAPSAPAPARPAPVFGPRRRR